LVSVGEHFNIHNDFSTKYHIRGAWVGSRLVTDEAIGKEFYCLAMGHPTVDAEGYYFGGDTQGLIDRINIPVIMLPAKVSCK
jgi:hypothetical protein